jgi:hypothetical protein
MSQLHVATSTEALADKSSYRFSFAYPAGSEPTGNAAAFRSFLLTHSLDSAHESKDLTKFPLSVHRRTLLRTNLREVPRLYATAETLRSVQHADIDVRSTAPNLGSRQAIRLN